MTTDTCDRCGITDMTVATFHGCGTCGPVPLCAECRAVHVQELLDEHSVMPPEESA